MARFLFSMQNLLDMKEKLEEQAKNEYSQANMRLQEAQWELEQLRLRQTHAEGMLRQEMQEKLDVRKIKRREDALEVIKMYVLQQKLTVIQREKEVEVARKKLSDAMKERKIFEKLREKAFEKFKIEENKKEQKENDELVSYRYGIKIEQR
jgi:flagellar FliJ protein